MVYQKPYTFIAGNYAKAAEVNADFDTLKDFVNDLDDKISNVEVSNTLYNKANKTGDVNIAFSVGQPTNVNQAERKGRVDGLESRINTLEAQDTLIIPDYVNGTRLTEASGTFPSNGVLYIQNASDSPVQYKIGANGSGTTFINYKRNDIVFLPVRAGGEYTLLNDVSNYILLFFSA